MVIFDIYNSALIYFKLYSSTYFNYNYTYQGAQNLAFNLDQSTNEENDKEDDISDMITNKVLAYNLEKDLKDKKEVIDLKEYANIRKKELQDARELKYTNDVTRT